MDLATAEEQENGVTVKIFGTNNNSMMNAQLPHELRAQCTAYTKSYHVLLTSTTTHVKAMV